MRRLGLLLGVLLAVWAIPGAAQPPPFGGVLSAPRVHCVVVNNAATILTAVGGACVAPGADLSIYLTSITASSTVIATATADQYLSVKSGTGGSCGTGTATIWTAYNLAFAPVAAAFPTAIKVTANSELCWMHAAVGSKSFVITGYIAP